MSRVPQQREAYPCACVQADIAFVKDLTWSKLLNMQVSVFAVGFRAMGFRAMASVYGYFGQPK